MDEQKLEEEAVLETPAPETPTEEPKEEVTE